jgi:translation initiation factor IF-3
MKLRPKVADHDFMTKFKGMRTFLEQGEKVKVTIMFRGREMVHQDIGRRLLDRVADAAKDVAIIERQPIMEGRNLFMILAPTHRPQPQPQPAKPATPTPTQPQQAAPVPVAAAAAAPQRKEASQSA